MKIVKHKQDKFKITSQVHNSTNGNNPKQGGKHLNTTRKKQGTLLSMRQK